MRKNIQPQSQASKKVELSRTLIMGRKKPQESQALVQAALDGDAAVLAFILEILRQHLTKRVRYELARRHLYMMEVDQEDLIQDVLIQMWNTDLGRFDATKASLATFATKRLRWMLIDRIRKQVRDHAVSLERLAEKHVPDAVAVRKDPLSLLEDIAYERALIDVVATLLASATAHNDDQAVSIVMRHHVDGVALKDIATETNRHPANVTRARKRAIVYAQVSMKRQTEFFAA